MAFAIASRTVGAVGFAVSCVAGRGALGRWGALRGAAVTIAVWAVVSAVGVVLAAIYLLKMLRETIWGPITHDENRDLPDLGGYTFDVTFNSTGLIVTTP